MGTAVTNRSLDADHHITAFVRRPETFSLRHEKLQILKGDVLNKRDVISALSGQEVMISALGTGKSRKKTNVYSVGAENIVEAAKKHHIERLICVTSAGV